MGGIPQYWIVNLRSRRVEVYTDPEIEQGRYGNRQDYPLDAMLPLLLADAAFQAIAVIDILRDSMDETLD